MCFKYYLPKTPLGKIDDTFMLALPHQKFYMRNLKWKTHIKKRVQCMSENHPPKTPWEKNGWYDMTLCWYCLIKNFIWETPREKTHRKKRVQYDVCNKLLFRETLLLILANLKAISYQCTHHIRNVEYGRLCEYLSEIITLLSLQVFVCPYYLWSRTILVQNITLSVTCLHLHDTSCITFYR